MRELGREALLAPETRGDAVEEAVEHRREPRELVVGFTELEAPLEPVFAPVGGRPGHPLDRAKGRREDPAGRERDDEQKQKCQCERVEQCRPPGLFVRREGDAGDDGAQSPALEDGRHCIEANVGAVDVEEATPAAGQRACRCGDELRGARRSQRLAASEDPELAFAPCLVGHVARVEAPLGRLQGSQLGRRTRASQIARVVREVPREQKIEAHCHHGDGHGNHTDDRQEQASPDAAECEAPHASR